MKLVRPEKPISALGLRRKWYKVVEGPKPVPGAPGQFVELEGHPHRWFNVKLFEVKE
jgi:hypothetical protein